MNFFHFRLQNQLLYINVSEKYTELNIFRHLLGLGSQEA